MEIDAMKGANSDLTESILAFVEAHFREEIHAEGIAEQVGIKSPCYFSKVFKELEGRSPREYRRLHLLGGEGRET